MAANFAQNIYLTHRNVKFNLRGPNSACSPSISAFPYLMYVAVMDGRTRPSHAALNGKIWRKDDPVWSVIFPPNGFNSRCRTRALTAGQIQREGLGRAHHCRLAGVLRPTRALQQCPSGCGVRRP